MAKFLKLTAGAIIEEATVGTSAGAGDSGKVPHLGSDGRLARALTTKPPMTVPYSTSVTLDATTNEEFRINPATSGPCAITVDGLVDGQALVFSFSQDATGGRLLSPIVVTGFTVMKAAGIETLRPAQAANAASVYTVYARSGGVAEITVTYEETPNYDAPSGSTSSDSVANDSGVDAGAGTVSDALDSLDADIATLSTTVSGHTTSIANKANRLLTIETVPGTTYTHVLADTDDKTKVFTDAAAKAGTVAPNSSVASAVGAVMTWANEGAGDLTITAGAGVTLRVPTGYSLVVPQYGVATLIKRATDTWYVTGTEAT